MKRCHDWLPAVLSVLTLMTIATTAVAEDKSFSGQVEIGVSGVDTGDNPARVNEYVNSRSEDGLSFAPRLSLETKPGAKAAFALDVDISGPRDQDYTLDLDLNRILRLDFDYQVMEHWKDHETLDQMGATARDDIAGGQPNVTTDKILAELQEANNGTIKNVGGSTFPADYDPRALYEQEVGNDYIVTRREFKNETDLALPFLPNVVFHAGLRVETREGMEQAISLSKCQSCHVSAAGKDIDERTEDFTFGATGKFGIVTVDYEYLTREFSADGTDPMRYYNDAKHANDYQLLYGTDATGTPIYGDLPFAGTPESEKDSHSLRARVDLPHSTSITASYLKSDVESDKESTPEYELRDGETLETELESFGGKLSTRLGNLRLALRGSTYEIETSDNTLYFAARDDDGKAETAWPGADTDAWHSAEAREVTEFGIDAVYRLTQGTTLNLGYEYEEVDREEDELGDTETHTLNAALKARVNKNLSARISYQYQDIDEPMAGAHIGIAQGDPLADQDLTGDPNLWYYQTATFTGDDALKPTWYWTAVYPNRQLPSTNQPEEVHETKANATWSVNPNMAATLFARLRMEENDSVNFEQTTFVPGASLWYAPNGKMNLTMAYTFNKQETENQMCVGWYHG